MLRWRLLLGTLIIAALVGLCWLDAQAARPGIWLLPVLLAFTLLATSEILHLARAGGLHPIGWPVYYGNLLLVLCQWLPLNGNWLTIWWLAAGLATGVFLIFFGEMTRYEKPGGVMANIAASVFSLVYVGVMLGFAVQLRFDWGVGAMATWILSVKMGDTGAYTVGRLFGRHKLCPVLSPGKTIEGAAGALLFASLGAWIGFRWFASDPPTTALGPWSWLVFGLLMGVLGMIGDLAESLLKRDVGCKDSSAWMPGFGGILDMLDSLLLTAPVAWLYWTLG